MVGKLLANQDGAPKTRRLRKVVVMYGADERIRTADLLITNQLLYQLSYVGVESPGVRRRN